MYQETPNKEEVDWIEDRVLGIYDAEKLKECDLDYLHNLEYGAEAKIMTLEMDFPPGGGIEGPLRSVLLDNPNADRESLTSAEQARLMMLKEEVRREVRRAKGHRLRLRREQRNRFANAIADLGNAIASKIPFV